MISTDGGLLVFYFSGLFCAQKYTLKNSNFCLDNGEYLTLKVLHLQIRSNIMYHLLLNIDLVLI
jgi:hypothetical protein